MYRPLALSLLPSLQCTATRTPPPLLLPRSLPRVRLSLARSLPKLVSFAHVLALAAGHPREQEQPSVAADHRFTRSVSSSASLLLLFPCHVVSCLSVATGQVRSGAVVRDGTVRFCFSFSLSRLLFWLIDRVSGLERSNLTSHLSSD